MRLKRYAQMPNEIIQDATLSAGSKLVLTALLMAARQDGSVKGVTIRSLAQICHRNKDTVSRHLQELEHKGYLSVSRRYRYSLTLGCPIYDSNLYRLCLPSEGDYTLIPGSILAKQLTGSAFAVLLYLYMRAGRKGRAYPSLRYMAGKDQRSFGVSKASICRALALLRQTGLIIRLACFSLRRKYACNSYFPTGIVPGRVRQLQPAVCAAGGDAGNTPSFTEGGGLKIRTHLLTNKITRGYTARKREKGVFNYSTLYKKLDRISGLCAGILARLLRPRPKDAG